MIEPTKFITQFALRFSDSIPLSYALKYENNERWFRIHSLPDSKRYPDTREEIQILLERQNCLISEIIGNGKSYYLLIGSISSTAGFPENYSSLVTTDEFLEIPAIDLVASRPDEFELHDGHSLYLCLAFKEEKWSSNSLNQLLLAVANDEVDNVLMISQEQNVLIAPYDGGVDIIMDSPKQAEFYKNRFKAWLSKHPEGL